MKVPQLRFDWFGEEWKQQELSELLEFKNGINADKDSYGHGTKFINVLDILNNDYILSENIIGSVNATAQQLQTYSVTHGDILFLRSSETREDVGKCNVYLDEEKPSVFGGFVIRGKKIANYSPFFLKTALNNSSARNQISSKAGGSTRYNVGQGILSEVTVKIPEIEEQQKISSFLMLFNQKIEKQQEKIEKLEQFKKGMMQKIFSQELRFKDEDGVEFGEWEEKKIRDIFEITRGTVIAKPSISEAQSSTHPYPVYSSQTKNKGILGWAPTYDFEGDFLTWTTDGANAGRVFKRKGKFRCTNVCGVLVEKEETRGYANLLITEILNLETPKHVSYVGNPKLMNGVMGNITIKIPSVEEQQKIHLTLKIMDTKIDKEKEKLMVLKEQKKGFMQGMFV